MDRYLFFSPGQFGLANAVENDRNRFWNANGPVVGKNSQNIDAFCTLVFRLVQNENTEYICKIESFLVFLFSKLLFN